MAERPSTLLVLPFGGFGVSAEFDPITGALQATSTRTRAESGLYGDLADLPVVLYRHEGRLLVRIGGRVLDLDGPVRVELHAGPQRRSSLTVVEGGEVLCALTYRTLPPELDLGVFLRDLSADPDRRAHLFT